MRATIYQDGVKRINAKIEVPLSDEDVGDYILSALIGESIDLKRLQTMNKRQLLHLAKEEIKTFGTENPRRRVNGIDNDTQVIVKNYVKQMFPELQ
jgi:hypothetical protein|tara:strand:- start:617 stop:904 length:288 start_codon:yes stop_codon:yes gene_type:complete